MKFEKRSSIRHKPALSRSALALAAVFAAVPAMSMELDTGSPDITARWDNTVKYSTAHRLNDANTALSSDANQGDGDTNFRRAGVISSRFDLLTELEVKSNNFGVRLSGAAWQDSNYSSTNDNNTAAPFLPPTGMVNSTQISSANQFSPYTKRTHGGDTELLDAFLFAKTELGGHAATVRVGQHTVVWGESLFFGDNAIAGTMSPVDVAKALSVPNLRFQEILRPVPQVSGQFQINEDLTAYAFYQANWVENKSQGSGSYFSPIDFQAGGNLILTGPGTAAVRLDTQNGKDTGQAGVSLKYRGDESDYGLYAVQFNSKSPVFVNKYTAPGAPTGFYDYYHNGITAYGASANRSIGKFNYAVEASVRNNQDLLSPNAYDLGAGAKYATGDTFHLNLSAFGTSMGKTALFDDALLIGEIAYNQVMKVNQNPEALSGCSFALGPVPCTSNSTKESTRLQVLFEPVWFQAMPGVDLRMPIGLSYMLKGSRNMVGPAPMAEDGGSVNLGLTGSYLDVWRFGMNFTHYFGETNVLFSNAGPVTSYNYGQYFRDRDYLAFYLTRTF